jgi:sulfur-carrier protein adenylyltransferase/sulfurtransferase
MNGFSPAEQPLLIFVKGVPMGLVDYFKSVPTMSADEVRRFIAARNPDDYNLIDVRQPAEYEKEHLPGARLIPLGELNERLAEIEPGKPVIVY